MLESRAVEILILAAVVLLLFGAKRLPDSARALGRSLRIFRSEVGAMRSDAADSGATEQAQAAIGPAPGAATAVAPGTDADADADHGDAGLADAVRATDQRG